MFFVTTDYDDDIKSKVLSVAADSDLGAWRSENYWLSLDAVTYSSSKRLLLAIGWAVGWAG